MISISKQWMKHAGSYSPQSSLWTHWIVFTLRAVNSGQQQHLSPVKLTVTANMPYTQGLQEAVNIDKTDDVVTRVHFNSEIHILLLGHREWRNYIFYTQ
jgi:hypothetical protein